MDGNGSHLFYKQYNTCPLIWFEHGYFTIVHASHVLQLLDVSCFKPFKIAFKKEKKQTMVRNNYSELNKITLASWVDKTLDQTLSKKISNMGLKL